MSGAKGVAERLLALEAAVAELHAQVGSGGAAAKTTGQPAGRPEPAPDGTAGGEKTASAADPSDAEQLAAALGNTRLAAVLARAGYASPEAVAAAPDEALLAIDGIGDKALKSIREKVTP